MNIHIFPSMSYLFTLVTPAVLCQAIAQLRVGYILMCRLEPASFRRAEPCLGLEDHSVVDQFWGYRTVAGWGFA